MSAQPPYKEIPFENIPGAPKWVNNLLYPMNQIFKAIWYGWVSFSYADNFNAQEKNFTILAGPTPTDNTYFFTLNQTILPTEIRVRRIIRTDNVGNYFTVNMDWNYQNGKVNITSIPNLTDAIKYNINLVIYFA